MAQLTVYTDALERRVSGFTQFLRIHGFNCGVSETIMALTVMGHADFQDTTTLLTLWRSIYAKTQQQWVDFQTLFEAYCHAEGPRFRQTERLDWDGGDGAGGRSLAKPRITATPSRRPLIAYNPDCGSPVSLVPDPDLAYGVLKVWSRRVLAHWAHPRGVRTMPPTGQHTDWQRTAVAGMQHAGELVAFKRSHHRPARPRVVTLLDVSGSMRPQVPFYLGLVWQWMRMGTRLSLILSSNRVEDATVTLRRTGPGGKPLAEPGSLGGGTRLGDACAWLWNHRQGLFDRKTVVVVVSDGFDTGDVRLIADFFPRLAHVVRRVVWLNPLLLEPGYQPRAQALAAALPYCTEHVGIRDEASWVDYARNLPNLQANEHSPRRDG